MSIYQKMLTNHPLVNILFAVVLLMGTLAYLRLPREQDPEINFYWININTVLPGASAEDVERLVTSPLEDALRNVQDIKFVSSNTREAVSNILVRFGDDMPARVFDKRLNDLRREIQNKANEELPEEAEDPFIFEVTTNNSFPTALVVVRGQADGEILRRHARLIKEDLERIRGVDRVQTFGLQDPELQVEIDPWALANHGLTAADIADGLTRYFRDTFAGTAQVGDAEWLVRVQSTNADPENLANFQLAGERSGQIPLNSVATVTRGREDAAQLVSFGGRPAVSMAVTKIGRTNTLSLVDRINTYIKSKNAIVRDVGIEIFLADDQTIQTREAIDVMQTNAILGLSLVLLVCWVFLGLRIATMVTLGIAFSIAGVFWTMDITDNTLNVSVLLGIVIVLGMLVDDAVVIVEAIYYRLQRGAAALSAVTGAIAEVGAPVASAVATTLAAFLPLMLLPGILGQFMFVVPFVVSIGLLVSLIEAFWILPAHVIDFSSGIRRASLDTGWRYRWTHALRIRYTRALCIVMRRPAIFLAGVVIAFGLAIAAVASGKIRSDFFTFQPVPLFYVNVDMPPASPLERTLRETVAVEQRLRALLKPGEARAVTSQAGVKLTEIEPLYGDQYGQIQVSLNPIQTNGRSVPEIVAALRGPLTQTTGPATISFLEISGGPPTTKPISVKVRSDDFDELRRAAARVRQIASAIEGIHDVTDNDVTGRSELVLTLDTHAIRQVGLDPGHAARLLRLHMDGEVVAFMRDQGEKVELRVRGKRRQGEDIQSILREPLTLPDGSVTPFGTLVSSKVRQGQGTIRHHNLRRSITVEADLDTALSDTVRANDELRAQWQGSRGEFPNTNLDFSGELDDVNESLDALLGLFLLGLGLMYLILATQFRSYFQPLLILVTVPMAFTGVAFGLLLTGNPLSLYTMYGIIALTGIAVNGAIVLIDAANTRIRNGMRPLHATVYAARRRVVPILMTTTTTIAGLFSLAVGLGGNSLLWGPVASSMVAGLAVASVLTLFVVPVLYRLFMRGHGQPQFPEPEQLGAALPHRLQHARTGLGKA